MKKGGELTAGDDMASGLRRRADVARGSTRGCDVALRPRGRAMAGPREAQVALTRGRRPRGRVHVGARVGHHVAGKDGSRRAHRYSATLVREGGGNANYSMLVLPLINRVLSHHFLRVGLCPTRLTFCKRRGRAVGVGFQQDGENRVDPSPRDHQYSTCRNIA